MRPAQVDTDVVEVWWKSVHNPWAHGKNIILVYTRQRMELCFCSLRKGMIILFMSCWFV